MRNSPLSLSKKVNALTEIYMQLKEEHPLFYSAQVMSRKTYQPEAVPGQQYCPGE